MNFSRQENILLLPFVFVLTLFSFQQVKAGSFSQILIDPSVSKDVALRSACNDLNLVLGGKVKTLSPSNISHNAILVLSENHPYCAGENLSSAGTEGYVVRPRVIKKQKVVIVTARTLRGLCYGLYYLREQVQLKEFNFINREVRRSPEFVFRMITQPFEVPGFNPVAVLPKPIISDREFDPMRPFDGAGYSAEDEARNILRAGLNTLYIGSYSFATTYRYLSDTIFPPGSEARKWVKARRSRFRELIAAAEKYHLDVCVNSDVFVYPGSLSHEDRWKAMAASLNEILSDFPEIDYVIGRFGENYSYFNPYFTGKGPKGPKELAAVIDSIHHLVVKKYKKVFIPRTWSLGDKSWHADPELYSKITKQVKADSNLVFSIKNTQTDFWRYNRFNPSLGRGNRQQAIEYLCQDGYNLKSSVPYYEVIRMAKGSSEIDQSDAGMKKAREMGIKYTWGWLSADGWCGPYLKREEWLGANIYGYTRLMWDVNEEPRDLATRWAALEFNVASDSKVAQTLAGILMKSEEMILKAIYFKNFSKSHNGWLPALNWIRDDMIGGGESSFKNPDCIFSNKPGTIKPIFNTATIGEDCREKEEALQIAEQMLRDFDRVSAWIPDRKQAMEIRNTLNTNRLLMEVIAYYIQGMFRYYNGEESEALRNLDKWKKSWDLYLQACRRPGAPTPMVNGGMVETCISTIRAINTRNGK